MNGAMVHKVDVGFYAGRYRAGGWLRLGSN